MWRLCGVFENPKFLVNNEKRLRLLQKSLSRKIYGSKNYEKARFKLVKFHEYITNCRKDYLHKISLYLINNYDIIYSKENLYTIHSLITNFTDTVFVSDNNNYWMISHASNTVAKFLYDDVFRIYFSSSNSSSSWNGKFYWPTNKHKNNSRNWGIFNKT